MKIHSYARLELGLLSGSTNQGIPLNESAYRTRYSETTEAFIEKYISAIMHGDLATIKTYSTINPNLITDIHYGMNPLHWASALGHIHMVRYLIMIGASVNTRTPQGYTSLHLAAFSGHLDAVKCLVLEGNCQINAQMNSGLTALDLAKGRKNFPIQAFLNQHEQ